MSGRSGISWMRGASKTIRWACLGFLLAWLSTGNAPSATASARRASLRHKHVALTARSSHARVSASRSHSHHTASRSYLRASARIPIQRTASPSPAFSPPAAATQDEQRIPRQAPRKTAAVQGTVGDSTSRGVVGAATNLGVNVPVVVRLEGTNVEEGQRVIRESGMGFTVANGMRDAAEKVVALAG